MNFVGTSLLDALALSICDLRCCLDHVDCCLCQLVINGFNTWACRWQDGTTLEGDKRKCRNTTQKYLVVLQRTNPQISKEEKKTTLIHHARSGAEGECGCEGWLMTSRKYRSREALI